MKKQYMAPAAVTIALSTESTLLTASLQISHGDDRLNGKDDFLTNRSEAGGWNSEAWSSKGED